MTSSPNYSNEVSPAYSARGESCKPTSALGIPPPDLTLSKILGMDAWDTRCLADARSKNRRCRNPINRKDCESASGWLQSGTQDLRAAKSIDGHLQALALLYLCNHVHRSRSNGSEHDKLLRNFKSKVSDHLKTCGLSADVPTILPSISPWAEQPHNNDNNDFPPSADLHLMRRINGVHQQQQDHHLEEDPGYTVLSPVQSHPQSKAISYPPLPRLLKSTETAEDGIPEGGREIVTAVRQISSRPDSPSLPSTRSISIRPPRPSSQPSSSRLPTTVVAVTENTLNTATKNDGDITAQTVSMLVAGIPLKFSLAMLYILLFYLLEVFVALGKCVGESDSCLVLMKKGSSRVEEVVESEEEKKTQTL